MENSLLFTSTAIEKTTQPWFDDDWGHEVIQQKISKTYIENEDDALLKEEGMGNRLTEPELYDALEERGL